MKKRIEKDLDTKERACDFSLRRLSRFIEPSILLFLSNGNYHGYELIDRLSFLGFHKEDIDIGAIYRVLRRLEKEGFVKSKWESDGGRRRRVYRITRQGRDLLASWVERIRERRDALNRFIKVYEEGL